MKRLARLPMRTPIVAHATVEAARSADRRASPWWRSMDGDWAFRLYDHPDSVDAEAVGSGDPLAAEGWRTIAVPGNWTMQGTSDVPHYTNVQMPFPERPPSLPGRRTN